METRRFSDDGERVIIVTEWLYRQVDPPRWRTKNRHLRVKPLTRGEIEYLQQRYGAIWRQRYDAELRERYAVEAGG